MRTRRKGSGLPEPHTPWEEIVPGLWMGGHYWLDGAGTVHPVVADGRFDVVVSLFVRPDHGPPPGVDHRVAEIPDGPLTAEQLVTVRKLAQGAAQDVAEGRRVLVRCYAGFNRSGLVVGQTLVDLGHSPAEAVDLIRRRRSRHALHNGLFAQYLTTGLDVAALLAGLDAPS
ncbi:protein phosphatase [Streptomyces spiroverticillatus]|uniref:Protein phosphatase n=1 Tax=Streptomyces finlayi TaxID=67296 RepID=A0A918X088_9ACTN|nr:protein phosphatase [Streptomyces finlayi]GHA17809.1 protein phosphatase [Streptomyces spiroverticillatus]GHC99575.1 protein phosphatase [Streptomyces finlayi]